VQVQLTADPLDHGPLQVVVKRPVVSAKSRKSVLQALGVVNSRVRFLKQNSDLEAAKTDLCKLARLRKIKIQIKNNPNIGKAAPQLKKF
jgi:hypothetical protein